jgi:hypothetical protein
MLFKPRLEGAHGSAPLRLRYKRLCLLMALEEPEKIDFIGIAPDGYCVLTIADTHDWNDAYAHIAALKEKLNTYVHFIRSGEIDRAYPHGKDSERKILVALREAPPAPGVEFFTEAKSTITALGIAFSWQVFHGG